MATISSIPVRVTPLDALWTLFQSQSKTVRKAFVNRLLEQTDVTTARPRKRKGARTIKQLDEQLYGSISLPADFDLESELSEALNSKYKL